jgi:hypothetical protein
MKMILRTIKLVIRNVGCFGCTAPCAWVRGQTSKDRWLHPGCALACHRENR